jgi:hypothetical protein
MGNRACAAILTVLSATTMIGSASPPAVQNGCVLPLTQGHHSLATVERLPLAQRSNHTFEADDPLPVSMRRELTKVGAALRSGLEGVRAQPRVVSGWERRFPWVSPPDSGPYFGYYTLSMYGADAWTAPCTLKPGADWDTQLLVVANVLGPAITDGRSASFTDDRGGMYIEPKVTRRVAGYPVYEDRVLIVTNRTQPLLVPVTVGRVLEARKAELRDLIAKGRAAQQDEKGSDAMTGAIAQMEALYEQMRQTNPEAAAQLKANIEKMRATTPKVQAVEGQNAATLNASLGRNADDLRRLDSHLSSLSPSARGARAYIGGEHPDEWGLASAGDEGALPLVSFNDDFFDRTAPRSALQVLALIPRGSEDGASAGWKILESIDYSAVAALLTK